MRTSLPPRAFLPLGGRVFVECLRSHRSRSQGHAPFLARTPCVDSAFCLRGSRQSHSIYATVAGSERETGDIERGDERAMRGNTSLEERDVKRKLLRTLSLFSLSLSLITLNSHALPASLPPSLSSKPTPSQLSTAPHYQGLRGGKPLQLRLQARRPLPCQAGVAAAQGRLRRELDARGTVPFRAGRHALHRVRDRRRQVFGQRFQPDRAQDL